MKRVHIKQKLEEIDCPVESLSLGDFDYIGEFTAKKNRGKDSPLFNSAGCFFRPNYERGLLIYSLVKRFEVSSFLEIGFGRGYGSFCAAKAMCDKGIDGKIYSIDPTPDEELVKNLTQVFPQEWFEKLNLFKGVLTDAIPKMGDMKFDMVYIDGDHRYEAVMSDWQNIKDRYNKFVLFDDYSDEGNQDIEVKRFVDDIMPDLYNPELIIMDRRVFIDDRGLSDDEINYGQVLVQHPDFKTSDYVMDW